ncbi:GTPase [Capnocytophaga canimorsus]|uniref:GTP-binding protein HSR1-related protein n=1 Tax=Capnocytophaga canimorsus (strain 5) TaxID=860228 RepID=F9YTZ2_CAPCC|nr:GTPase [Capnocytophaga canimorsus]AEK22926.1 GTP-binding protein HSR1-related protein [Capnocytophaga canimorsus Cc5]
MMNKKIEIAELSNRLQDLINKTYKILDDTNSQELKERLKTEIAELNNRTDLRVAFVGQYSSGKSTIISAITGNRDIKIDANVATDKVSEYRWNNIVLLDTPGILAGKVEHHDERTKEALKKSDLIVYVITSQLFDDIIFENFIDLAYNQALKDKMLIAVNKMSMEKGGFAELEQNYTSSIKSIFKERGYDFDFDIVFIDAADYIEGTEDNDDEFIELSNFNKFICTLNEFINKKGLIKKQFDSPIRLLKSSIADVALSNFDPNLQILLEQGVRRIRNSKKNIERKVELLISEFEQKVKNRGYELSDCIGESDEENFKKEQEDYEKFVSQNVNEVSDKIEKLIKEEEEELLYELENFENKEAVLEYQKSIDIKLNVPNLSISQKVSLEKQKNIINFLQKGSGEIVKQSVGNAALTGLRATSGSNLHRGVYQVGKFFGHKFKPWEAVKTAGQIGKWAKAGGVALSVVSIGMDIWQKNKEDKQRKEIKVAKDKFNNEIRSFVSGMVKELKERLNDYLQDSYDTKISELDKQKIEITNLENENKQFSEAISKLDAEYIDFIEIINK